MKITEGDFFQKGAFLKNPHDQSLLICTGGSFDPVQSFQPTDREVFYLKDFYSNSYLRYVPDRSWKLSTAEQEQLLKELDCDRPSFRSIGTEDGLYQEDFQDLLKNFSSNLRKVVMVSRESFQTSEDSVPLKYLIRKALTFGAGIPYGVWGPGFGIIGSTPEELFHLSKGELATHALAGTSKKGSEAELMDSQKDLLEHNLVVQDISEKLTPFSGAVQVGEIFISEFKDIIHLKTDIRAAVSEDTDISSLVSALSPTAALGGYPKKESLKFLKETSYSKKYPERTFGSAFGVVSGTESRFVVMIRNVQWKNEIYYIESGGGVVPGSELAKELQEISWKRSVVKDHYL